MKKKCLFSILALLTVAVIVLSLSFNIGGEEDDPLKKIDEDVFSSSENENGERTVIVFRTLPTEEQINSRFYEKLGYSTELYENEDSYKSIVVPRVTNETYQKYGKEIAESLEEGQKRYNDNTTILKQELLSDFDVYIREKN